LMTRWLSPAGVTASAGASEIFVVPSAIVALPARMWRFSKVYGWGSALCQSRGPLSAVEPAPRKTEQAPRHEDHDQDKDAADRDQVDVGEKARERLAQQQKEGSADDRPD